MGRRPIGERPMTAAERQRRRRERMPDVWSSKAWLESWDTLLGELRKVAAIMKSHGLKVDELQAIDEKLSDIESQAYGAIWPDKALTEASHQTFGP